MKYLLLGGAPSVGKTSAIYRLAQFLLTKGYVIIEGNIPTKTADFKIVLEGLDNIGNLIRIIINSATDDKNKIEELKKLNDKLSGSIQIIISSIRDGAIWPRELFFDIMKIDNNKDVILEIPLGKVNRRGNNFPVQRTWYENTIDNLLNHTLSNSPFNVFSASQLHVEKEKFGTTKEKYVA
jgi:hypothetical protein